MTMETEVQDTSHLRQELKDWEREFAAENGGRKAGREDIKKHPAIAAKYKEYNRLRTLSTNIVSNPTTRSLQSEHPTTKSKRKHPIEANTPSKKPRSSVTFATPTKKTKTTFDENYESPAAVRNLLKTPTIFRTSIGPTPQRDGKALGLFDLLTPSPLKDKEQVSRNLPAASPVPGSKSVLLDAARTPKSKSKSSNGLDRSTSSPFRTPSKSLHAKSPCSNTSAQFLTPAFLRRDSQRYETETSADPAHEGSAAEVSNSPVFVRMPAKPPIRGLSAILAGLRNAKELLMPGGSSKEAAEAEAGFDSNVPVEDSQNALGTADGIAGDVVDKISTTTGPRKIWKKKGQKRTTRRVMIRPTRNKSKISGADVSTFVGADSDDDDEDTEPRGSDHHRSGSPDLEDIPEEDDTLDAEDTQSSTDAAQKPEESDDEAFEGSPSKTKSAPKKGPKAKANHTSGEPAAKKERKFNPNAQSKANFRRLKIRSKGAGGRRFGRGR